MVLYTFHTGIFYFFFTELLVIKFLSVTLEPLYYQLPCLSLKKKQKKQLEKMKPVFWLGMLVSRQKKKNSN